ncbi:MAG TPA: SDR family oxidoreductase [Holophagaceae bacterium]|nr:SDR family oxidoreductase [Holophagaceae bacterium]
MGGRSRLGRALAEDLARDHHLVLTSSRDWAGESWPAALGARTLRWDAEDPQLPFRMATDLETLGAEGLRLDGAVLVAGTFPEQPLGTWTPDGLQSTLRANLMFPLLAAQALATRLAEGACLQFIVDAAIHKPFLKRLPYTAAKAGQAALVPGLARALAPRIRVVGHALGTALPGDHDDVEALKKANLLGRIGSPTDLARALRYAADSPYLTGEILTLDGGWSVK